MKRTVGLVLGLIIAPPAHAGPVEQLAQVALHPTDPNVMVLRYDNGGGGLLHTDDGGATWRMQCGQALDPALRGVGRIGITSDGTVLVSSTLGVLVGEAGGCRWSRPAELEGTWVNDIAIDPSDPGIAYAVTGLNGARNGIWRRDASGMWSALELSEDFIISRLRVVATSAGVRFYEQALRDLDKPMLTRVLRVSDDEGQTWDEFSAALNDSLITLEAVDPTAPDRIVGSVVRPPSAPDSVLVSFDRGETFVEYLSVAELGAITLAPDGRVWIGDLGAGSDSPGGVWHAASLDQAPERVSDVRPFCLAWGTDEILHACEPWSFGAIDPASGALQRSFTLSDLQYFLTCDGVDMAATCKRQLCGDYCGIGHWPSAPACCVYDDPICGPAAVSDPDDLRCEGHIPPMDDAGVDVPPTDAGIGSTTTSDDGCGCRSAGRQNHVPLSPVLVATAVAALSAARRRRRSMTHPQLEETGTVGA